MGRRLYSKISRMLLTLLFVHVEPVTDFELDHGNMDADFATLGPPELLLNTTRTKLFQHMETTYCLRVPK
jgi:hypothetical protein